MQPSPAEACETLESAADGDWESFGETLPVAIEEYAAYLRSAYPELEAEIQSTLKGETDLEEAFCLLQDLFNRESAKEA